MSKKVNISQLEELLKKAGLDNGELKEVIYPIKNLNNQRRYGQTRRRFRHRTSITIKVRTDRKTIEGSK